MNRLQSNEVPVSLGYLPGGRGGRRQGILNGVLLLVGVDFSGEGRLAILQAGASLGNELRILGNGES